MSLIPCCDLYADHKPCRCAHEAKPYCATRKFTINGAVTIEEASIIKVHPHGAVFVGGRGPIHMPQIKGAIQAKWLVAVDGDTPNDERWTRPETSGRYDLIDADWLD